MQPCPVCGNTGVDANGYCTTCSTYLGVPQQPGYPAQPSYPAQPGYGAQPGYPQEPQYGAAYPGQPMNAPATPAPTTPYPAYPPQPSSAVPYSSAPASGPGYGPTSAPPTYNAGYGGQAGAPPGGYASAPPAGFGGAPASAPPGFSGPGYGYPSAPPQPPKKSYTGAIAAASVGLVVLIGLIVTVVVVKNHKSTPVTEPTHKPSISTSGGSSASAAAGGVDPCVVGDWKVTSEQLTDDFPDYSDVPLVLDNTYKITFSASGSAKEDYEAYDTETDYFATYNGHKFQLAFDGTLTYNFTTKSGKMQTSQSITDGQYGKWLDGTSIGTGTNQFDDYPWAYTCSGDVMTRTLSNDTQRLTKV